MTEKFLSPMLAKEYDPAKLAFPKLASPKLDGWRGVIHRPKNVSEAVTARSGKPFRNRFTQQILTRAGLSGLDGEVVVGAWNTPETYNRTETAMKKFEGEPDLSYWVFDVYDEPRMRYVERLALAAERLASFYDNLNGDMEPVMWRINEDGERVPRVKVLKHKLIRSLDEMDDYEEEQLELGFEGIMLNDPNGMYKYGRSTVNEGTLLKVKRYTHDEAQIVGFQELMHNDNVAFKDELGRTKRSSHQENKRESGMLGAYVCRNDELWPGVTFNVSAGSMTHVEKTKRWVNHDLDKGKWIRVKHLPHGAKDAPRHGLFAGFRADEDRLALA